MRMTSSWGCGAQNLHQENGLYIQIVYIQLYIQERLNPDKAFSELQKEFVEKRKHIKIKLLTDKELKSILLFKKNIFWLVN